MDEDNVSTAELVEAMLAPNAEIIEDYPDDQRGHSHLVLGPSATGKVLHICCAVHEDCLVFTDQIALCGAMTGGHDDEHLLLL